MGKMKAAREKEMRRKRKLRIMLAAATVLAVAAGTIAAFAASSSALAALPAPQAASPGAASHAPGTSTAASSPLEAAAAAVGFHPVVDLSAGNVEGLPANTLLHAPSPSLLPVGSEAPDFTLSTPEGKPVRLSAFRGKTVLLEFFATWCPHCQAEIPHLESLLAELDSGTRAAGAAASGAAAVGSVAAAAPVVFLSVNADSEDAASVYAFDAYFHLPWPSLLDPGGQPGSFNASGGFGPVTTTYGVAMYPTFYIIDSKGRVAWRADREQPDGLILQELQAVAGR